MAKLKQRYLLVIILLGITATMVSALQYESSHDETAGLAELNKIPLQMGKWKGIDLHLEEFVYKILETRAIIHRNYTNDTGNTVLLSIVHYYDTKVNFHAPEACLGGRGERTEKFSKNITINGEKNKYNLEVAEILSSSVNGDSVSYYFYRTGDYTGRSYMKMRFRLAQNAFKGLGKSGSLIRVTGYMNSTGNQLEVEQLIESFMQELMPVIKSQ